MLIFDVNFTFFYVNESHEIRNDKSKTSGTCMKRFRNASHDGIQKIMDKSKNKNTTKTTVTWMNLYHTWAKHRGKVLEIEKVEPKKLDEIPDK